MPTPTTTRTTRTTSLALAALAATLVFVPGVMAQEDGARNPRGVRPAGGGGGQLPAAAPIATDVVAIPKLREQAAAMLMEYAERGEPEQRANALEGLTAMPARLEQVVRANLRSSNAGVRGIAAMVVGKARLSRMVDNVRPLLNDEVPQVRAAAILALSKNGARVDPTPLGGMLEDSNVGVRAQAAFVLGEMGNKSAAPMLLEASRAPGGRADPVRDRLMRLQIAEALVKVGESKAIDEIRAALYPARPEDLEACALAAQILGQIKDEANKGALRSLMRENWDGGQPMPIEIRMAAAMSLARMGDTQPAEIGLNFITSDAAPQRAQAALLLGESGEQRYLGNLSQMLTDKEPLVRIAAAAGILKISEGVARGKQ